MLLETANWYFLPYYFNVLSSCYFLITANESEVSHNHRKQLTPTLKYKVDIFGYYFSMIYLRISKLRI